MKKNIQSLIQIIKKLIYILDRNQKRGAIWLFCVIIVSSILELLGVTAILPFVQAVTNPEIVMKNKYILVFMSKLHIRSSEQLLLFLGICVIVLYLLKNILLIYSSYVQYNYSSRIQMQLSIKMLKSYINRPYLYFTNTNSSEIIRGCSADITSVYNIISMLADIVTQVLTVGVIGVFLICTDPIMAISILIIMFVILICIILFFKPTIKKAGKESLKVSTEMTKVLYQSINGIKEILVMQRREVFLDAYRIASDKNRKVQKKYNTLNACPDRIVEGICIGGIIGVVCIRLISNSDSMLLFIPKLAAFAIGSFKILPSVGKIASRMNVVVFSIPGLDNVYQNIKEVNKRYYRQGQKAMVFEKEKNEKIQFDKKIEIRNVSWKYNDSETDVLTDINLDINKGESIALIGESGSGKTTLSDILLGLMKPTEGTIKMDGIDVYSIPYQWAQVIGYVPQFVYLFDDTIRNNIAFGQKKEKISDTVIWDALEQAQLKNFVQQLPEGLDTFVGESGVRLSGGQRQRIAIARALYNKPQILVLDEATASLDNETEVAVMESIEALQGQVTLIIVAHRLSTIKNCDYIYEIKEGKAVLRDKVEVLKM